MSTGYKLRCTRPGHANGKNCVLSGAAVLMVADCLTKQINDQVLVDAMHAVKHDFH